MGIIDAVIRDLGRVFSVYRNGFGGDGACKPCVFPRVNWRADAVFLFASCKNFLAKKPEILDASDPYGRVK